MEKSEKVLWDKCFESMSEDEYCSTTLGKLDDIFREYLINKAAAYDRLMSGGRKTLKEIANFLQHPIAIQPSRLGCIAIFANVPFLGETEWKGHWMSAISCDLDYTGDWKDSLTLPDGCEKPCSKN